MTHEITVGLIQMRHAEDPEENLKQAVAKIEEAASKGARIIALSELFRTRYFPQTEERHHFKLAEPIPGPTTKILGDLAKRLKTVIVAPIFERSSEEQYFNSAAAIDVDGKLLGAYRKMHIPHEPFFYEKFYFKPGDAGVKCFQTEYGPIAVLICWDQWFPESSRIAALEGAQIIFYPTAIGSPAGEATATVQKEFSAWRIMHQSHAIANGVFTAAVNRIGEEGELQFWGGSFVAGPFGEIIAQTDEPREEILIASCDLSKIDDVRKAWPFLRERRIEMYHEIISKPAH